jgi:hypothetical protein
MTTSEIISNFELYVDDMTELSASEELSLLNKVFKKIWISRPWEFAKKSVSGAITGIEIDLPTDFAYLYPNYNYTDNTIGIFTNSSPVVIYVGSEYNPIKVVNYSDRRRYYNQSGYAYIDSARSKLVFTVQPTESTYEFDYIFIPADLALGASLPVMAGFVDSLSWAIVHGMAVDDMIIQIFDKAKSYAKENEIKYNSHITDMAYVNANLLMN